MTAEQGLLRDDFAARNDALDEKRSFIVQAPAGSGKTELLIQRYLRLLSVAALRRAELGDRPDQEHLQRTFDLATAALARDEAHSWGLLINPRRMRIQTLDSLNAAIARSRPITSPGSASGVRVVVDAELLTLHRDAAIATLDYVAMTGAVHDVAAEVLEHLDNNTGIYVDYLARMLGTRDQWLPFTGSGTLSPEDASALRRTLEGNLEKAVSEQLSLTAATFPQSIGHELGGLFDCGRSSDLRALRIDWPAVTGRRRGQAVAGRCGAAADPDGDLQETGGQAAGLSAREQGGKRHDQDSSG